MRRPTWLAVAILCVASSEAAGQDGLRSPVLPEQGPAPTATTERDLFLVTPEYYREQPKRPSPTVRHPVVLIPTLVPWGTFDPLHQLETRRLDTREAAVGTTRELSRTPELSMTAPVPLPPGPPKTFYVIPGCYAGDRPPPQEWLPAGCDSSALRVVPPR